MYDGYVLKTKEGETDEVIMNIYIYPHVPSPLHQKNTYHTHSHIHGGLVTSLITISPRQRPSFCLPGTNQNVQYGVGTCIAMEMSEKSVLKFPEAHGCRVKDTTLNYTER